MCQIFSPEHFACKRMDGWARLWQPLGQVFGVELKPNGPSYGVYEEDTFTDEQRLEMLQFRGFVGIANCTHDVA